MNKQKIVYWVGVIYVLAVAAIATLNGIEIGSWLQALALPVISVAIYFARPNFMKVKR